MFSSVCPFNTIIAINTRHMKTDRPHRQMISDWFLVTTDVLFDLFTFKIICMITNLMKIITILTNKSLCHFYFFREVDMKTGGN